MLGSIPAYAGNPFNSVPNWQPSKVYPRLRGEPYPGVSNLAKLGGSIPAYAGNPPRRRKRLFKSRVYPRLRGEPVLESRR